MHETYGSRGLQANDLACPLTLSARKGDVGRLGLPRKAVQLLRDQRLHGGDLLHLLHLDGGVVDTLGKRVFDLRIYERGCAHQERAEWRPAPACEVRLGIAERVNHVQWCSPPELEGDPVVFPIGSKDEELVVRLRW
jgi:hypothetical protein